MTNTTHRDDLSRRVSGELVTISNPNDHQAGKQPLERVVPEAFNREDKAIRTPTGDEQLRIDLSTKDFVHDKTTKRQ